MKGVKMRITISKTPQQNGLIEQMNMTILERVIGLLVGARLQNSF